MKVKFTITNNSIIERLKTMEQRGRNLAPLMIEISNDMHKETINRFTTKKDPNGKKWQRLSANTIAAKTKLTKEGKVRKKKAIKPVNIQASILNNTGRLRNSIKRDSNKNSAIVSTSTVYAATHQFGAKDRVIVPTNRKDPKHNKPALRFYTANGFVTAKKVRVTIPARPFLGLSDKQIKKYNKKIYKYLTGY